MAERGERVAFLGLGIMGSRMAANLARAGFDVVAWNRTAARAEELAAATGAAVAASPAEAAGQAGVVITMVVDSADVEEVLLGPGGAAEALRRGDLVIDMSTIAPATSRALAGELGRREVAFVDAPVTGSKPRAEDGTLTIMAGGDPAAFERARPLFEAMGELVVHVGPSGHGTAVKLLNNMLAAVNAAALAEALAAAEAMRLDAEALLRVVAAGSGASAMLDLKARPMLEHDYEPLFKLAHMLKDVRHTLAAGTEAGAALTLGAAAERLYAEAAEKGLQEADFAAVREVAREP